MSFIPHINNITCKATKVLNFIKRNLYKCSQYPKSNAYLSHVRPSLEYASSVWDPYYKTHNLTTEKVQRRAAHWTLGNYDYHSSVSAMLQDLNWPTLQYRQQRARLSLFYKFFTQFNSIGNTTLLHSQQSSIQTTYTSSIILHSSLCQN